MNSFNKSFSQFTQSVNSTFANTVTRSTQYIKEVSGNAGETTQLPHDYVELENRIEALRTTHQRLLQATSQYTNEGYDYPANLRENFVDLGKSIGEKVNLLSKASSAGEAQAALTAPPSTKPQPKTFSHAIARAALAGSQAIATSTPQGSTAIDPLSAGLEKIAVAEEKVGEARIDQDTAIQNRFLAGWSATLNQNIKAADKARTAVQNARLQLDAVKGRIQGSGRHEEAYSTEQRNSIEQAEDAFVMAVDQATSIMRNVLDTPEPLRNLAELVKAQHEFHARAADILEDVAKGISEIQVEQEENYRKTREQ